MDLGMHFLYEFFCISPWIVGLPIIIYLSNIYKNSEGVLFISIHIVLALLLFAFHSTLQTLINSWYFEGVLFTYSNIQTDFVYYFDIRFLLYVGIIIGVQGIEFQRKRGEVEIRKQKLKTELEWARLSALLNSVQPEFLIDNLNSISDLIEKNTQKAEKLLLAFSDLTRLLVRYTKKSQVHIWQDIKVYRCYANFLSIKYSIDIYFDTVLNGITDEHTIPKSFFILPLLDRILIALKINEVKQLQNLKYVLSPIESGIRLEVRLSYLKDLSHNRLKKVYKNFTQEFGLSSYPAQKVNRFEITMHDSEMVVELEMRSESQ